MPGYFALVLHAHLPFVRHPEHESALEESWLFEAVLECYLPLLELLQTWERERLNVRVTLSVSPTLGAMLLDPLLSARCERRLNALLELAGKEVVRTRWEPALHRLAAFYLERFRRLRQLWLDCDRNLMGAFRRLHEARRIELITCAATHAVLPLLADHPPSVRAQVRTALDHHRACFGGVPRGFWLPECAYDPAVEPALVEANLYWTVLETHGLLHGTPRPRYGVFAPVFTPAGLAVFGRDPDSARQVWSREGGFPGDPHFRDFYRDIGFDLEWEYVRPYLPSPDHRGFTGIKYHRITGPAGATEVYDRDAAVRVARAQARRFLEGRRAQLQRLETFMDRPPILVAPFDAELFGHWWYEGPEFLDALVREAAAHPEGIHLDTPGEYLRRHRTHQLVQPAASSWGEEGYLAVWLSEKNAWVHRHLAVARERMSELAKRWPVPPAEREARALRQAAREVLLAQASDWPFLLHHGSNPGYARRRLREHILRFNSLYRQLTQGAIDEAWLSQIEALDNLFPQVDFRYWA